MLLTPVNTPTGVRDLHGPLACRRWRQVRARACCRCRHSDPSPLWVGSRCREHGGEVEVAEGVWGEEGGDLLDLRAAQGEHVDGARREGLGLAVPGVEAEGELS